MPFPADGAVIAYTITLGKRTIRGEIESREKARQDYQQALERGHTAGLLEQERADTFTQRLGNLPCRRGLPGHDRGLAAGVQYPTTTQRVGWSKPQEFLRAQTTDSLTESAEILAL